ncbi:MAG TPA: response regulator [Terriglobales bacterium]|nr:response regulator [Terriglobales bacterium]
MSVQCPTILCVDDAPYLLELRRLQLEGVGYRVLTAATPQDALGMFAKYQVDLLLTDYLLPEMNGIALALTMKRSRPDLLVVLTSGWPNWSDDSKGVDLILPKPMDSKELRHAILRLLPSAQRYGT